MTNEADTVKVDPLARYVAEPKVPQYVIDAFYDRYCRSFDLERDDDEWRNTWRFKHDHIQVKWEGWRDGYLALNSRLPHEAEGKAEPYCWVYDSPGHFDPQNGGEPPYTDFSDVSKPGYQALYTHPPDASPTPRPTAAQQMDYALRDRSFRRGQALWLILGVAEGSQTINSLQHIAKIARGAIDDGPDYLSASPSSLPDPGVAGLVEAARKAERAIKDMLTGISVHNSRKIDRFQPIEGPVVSALVDGRAYLIEAIASIKGGQ